jgi:nucleoside-diphosphate-sugar epimerase
MSTLLVTGGSGFIGSYYILIFLPQGSSCRKPSGAHHRAQPQARS